MTPVHDWLLFLLGMAMNTATVPLLWTENPPDYRLCSVFLSILGLMAYVQFDAGMDAFGFSSSICAVVWACVGLRSEFMHRKDR